MSFNEKNSKYKVSQVWKQPRLQDENKAHLVSNPNHEIKQTITKNIMCETRI